MNNYLPIKNNQKGFSQVVVVGVVIVLVALAIWVITGGKSPQVLNKPKVLLADHYDLNLVGVPEKGDTKLMEASSTPTLALPIQKECKIIVMSGDFKVGSGNCNETKETSFYLPANSSGDTEATTYAVYYKALDPKLAIGVGCKKESDGSFCPTQSMVIVRSQDSSFTSDATKLLTNIYLDLSGKESPQRYQLFDDTLKNKAWEAGSAGQRLVQLKFYPQSPEIIELDGAKE